MDYTSDSEILSHTVPVDEGPGVSRLTIVMADGDTLTSEPIPIDEIKKVGIKWCDTVREQHLAREAAAEAEGRARRKASARSAEEATDTTQPETAPGEDTPTSGESSSTTESLHDFARKRLPNVLERIKFYEDRIAGDTSYLLGLKQERRDLEGLTSEVVHASDSAFTVGDIPAAADAVVLPPVE
jgi:hypothetical protein